MSNVASVLKEEISRIARKEIRRETATLKKASAAYRSEIAALKKRALEFERQLRQVGKRAERSAPLRRTKTPSRRALASVPRASPPNVVALVCRQPNAVFSSAHRRSRSTTGRRARHARAPSICRRSSRSGTWVAGKRTRFWRPAKPLRQLYLACGGRPSERAAQGVMSRTASADQARATSTSSSRVV